MFFTFVWILGVLIAPWLVTRFWKWFIFPYRLRNKNPVPILAHYEPTSLETLTPEMRESIGNFVRQFTAEGFSVALNLTHRPGPGEPWAVTVLLVNRVTNDIGQLIFTTANLQRSCVFAIRSAFADGTDVVTACKRDVGFLPADPRTRAVRFSWVRDVATIAEAHRRRLKQLGLDNTSRIAPEPGREMEYVVGRRDYELNRFVQCGYFYRDEKAGVLRKTWKGCYLAAWKLQQPIKGWRYRYRDRQARQLWNGLGMNGWRPPAAGLEPTAGAAGVSEIAETSDELSYQTQLPPNELRVSREHDTTVLRLGQPTPAGYLVMNWATLLGIAIDLLVVAAWSIKIWLQYRFFRQLGLGWMGTGYFSIAFVSLFIFLAGWQSYRLVRRIRFIGGTSVIIASHSGLHFRVAPAKNRTGFIPREDIRSFQMVRQEAHLAGSIFRLDVLLRGNMGRQPILLATTLAPLQEALKTLTIATGIANQPTPPPIPTAVTQL